MKKYWYLKILAGAINVFIIASLIGCESKEEVNIEVIPVEVTSEEETVASDVSLKDFDVSKLYCKERINVCNHYVIDENGVLWGTGINDFGQLGIATSYTDLEKYTEPVKIAEDVLMVDASDNGYFTIYLTNKGELYGIGSNMLGLLGQPYEECYSEHDYLKVTDPVLLMDDVKYASAGRESIVALKNDGSVWWWGEYGSTYLTQICSNLHELYWKADEDDTNPVKMLKNSPTKLLDNCVYATTGDFHGAAITESGELYTWGLNLYGECGIEVGDDDYIRIPTKVLDGVKMVWVERVNDCEDGINDTTNFGIKYNFNVFVQTVDDKYMASGVDLGDKEKTIQLTGDIVTPSTEKYSDVFVPIELEEYSEEGCRLILNELSWGDSREKVNNILEEHHLTYWACNVAVPVDNSETEMIIKSIDVNCSNYLLDFDENDCLEKIVIQVGGSRNGLYLFGMKLDEIKELLTCNLVIDPETNEYVDIYDTEQALDGTYYKFVFEKNNGELIRVEESATK